MHGQGIPNSAWFDKVFIVGAMLAHIKNAISSYFGLVAGSQDSQCLVKRIPISTRLDKDSTAVGMPEQ